MQKIFKAKKRVYIGVVLIPLLIGGPFVAFAVAMLLELQQDKAKYEPFYHLYLPLFAALILVTMVMLVREIIFGVRFEGNSIYLKRFLGEEKYEFVAPLIRMHSTTVNNNKQEFYEFPVRGKGFIQVSTKTIGQGDEFINFLRSHFQIFAEEDETFYDKMRERVSESELEQFQADYIAGKFQVYKNAKYGFVIFIVIVGLGYLASTSRPQKFDDLEFVRADQTWTPKMQEACGLYCRAISEKSFRGQPPIVENLKAGIISDEEVTAATNKYCDCNCAGVERAKIFEAFTLTTDNKDQFATDLAKKTDDYLRYNPEGQKLFSECAGPVFDLADRKK